MIERQAYIFRSARTNQNSRVANEWSLIAKSYCVINYRLCSVACIYILSCTYMRPFESSVWLTVYYLYGSVPNWKIDIYLWATLDFFAAISSILTDCLGAILKIFALHYAVSKLRGWQMTCAWYAVLACARIVIFYATIESCFCNVIYLDLSEIFWLVMLVSDLDWNMWKIKLIWGYNNINNRSMDSSMLYTEIS